MNQSDKEAELEIEFYAWQTQYGHEEAVRIAKQRAAASEKSEEDLDNIRDKEVKGAVNMVS